MDRKRDRGWNLEKGEWVYGNYFEVRAGLDIFGNEEYFAGMICEDSRSSANAGNFTMVDVVRESAGRGTGEFVGGQELFEGDIIRVENVSPDGVDSGETGTGVICYGTCNGWGQNYIGFYIDWKCTGYAFHDKNLNSWIDACRNPNTFWGWEWNMTIIGTVYEQTLREAQNQSLPAESSMV